MNTRIGNKRAGVSMVYLIVMIPLLFGLGGIALDGLMLRSVKTDLQSATDAAALYGASGIRNIGVNGLSASYAQARQGFNDEFAARNAALKPNQQDQKVTLATSDIILGVWDNTNRTFTSNSNATVANAIRVTARRTAATGNSVKLFVLPVMPSGSSFSDLTVTSIARLIPGQEVPMSIPATSNPWLAGMPNGTVANNNGNPHNNPDYAPRACPIQIPNITLTAGNVLTFDGINGGANNFPTDVRFNADGNTGWLVNNKYSQLRGPEHGKSDIKSPINSLIGVFLGPADPSLTNAPATLDFSTSSARDFAQLEPQLKQTFFIGDGLRDNGVTQTFKVPSGTTRLFIGTMDEYEWNNNQGGFGITTHVTGKVMLVK